MYSIGARSLQILSEREKLELAQLDAEFANSAEFGKDKKKECIIM